MCVCVCVCVHAHTCVCVCVSQAAGELKGGIDKKDLELSEDEESEDDQSSRDSKGESPTNQTFVKAEKNDDSLSLRAQIVSIVIIIHYKIILLTVMQTIKTYYMCIHLYQDKQRELNKEKTEDLVVLKQQQDLLKRLITQQKQVCFLMRDIVIYTLSMIHH